MKEVVLCMIAAGKYALDEIANISGLSLDEVKKLQADKKHRKVSANMQWDINIVK